MRLSFLPLVHSNLVMSEDDKVNELSSGRPVGPQSSFIRKYSQLGPTCGHHTCWQSAMHSLLWGFDQSRTYTIYIIPYLAAANEFSPFHSLLHSNTFDIWAKQPKRAACWRPFCDIHYAIVNNHLGYISSELTLSHAFCDPLANLITFSKNRSHG